MKPELINDNVRAPCPDCGGSITTFESMYKGTPFGAIIIDLKHKYNGQDFSRILYLFLRCAGCGRGGLAKIHDNGKVKEGVLEEFYPVSVSMVKVPESVPRDIIEEFREAERCIAYRTYRAASALLRSTLEKTLKTNGYTSGTLYDKIVNAAEEGIITSSRQQRAHSDVRVFGNDVLHEDWRKVEMEEVLASHHYVQRILEDFYDEREIVEKILKEKRRINNNSSVNE